MPCGQEGSEGVRVSRWRPAPVLSHCLVQTLLPSLLPFPARPASHLAFAHSLSLSTCFPIRTSKAQEMEAQSWERIREGAALTDSNLASQGHCVMSIWQVVRAPSPTSWSTTAVFHLFLYFTHFPWPQPASQALAALCRPPLSAAIWAALWTGLSSSMGLNKGNKGIFH